MAIQVKVNQDVPRSVDEGVWTDVKGTKRGELCIIDFFTQMVIEENCYQVRLGTVTSPVTSDVAITDADADGAVAALAGTTIMPCELWMSFDTQDGDSLEVAAKSVADSTMTSGTAFEPLNLCLGGKPAITKGMVGGAGAIVVAAELATTTRQHFHVTQEFAKDSGAELATHSQYHYGGSGTGMRGNPIIWHPILLPVLPGASCFYMQCGGAAACTYFCHFDYIELPTTSVT